jgi:Transmembrane amino acid transporter protein
MDLGVLTPANPHGHSANTSSVPPSYGKPLIDVMHHDSEAADRSATEDYDPSASFKIKRRTEMGLMAEMFLGRRGVIFFYSIMVIYLFGDLTIYAVSIPLTLSDYAGGNFGFVHFSDPYYCYVILFALFVGPFCFFDFQGTVWLQYFTLATRNFAFFTMITIGIIRIAQGDGTSASDLKYFEISGLPTLFGTAVYSFMCHHSLPSIVTPVRNKRSLFSLFAIDYVAILGAYLALCLSAVFAYGNIQNPKCSPHPGAPCHLQELYTLNFSSYKVQWLSGFLTLFPVFTLTTSFPLIAITLRNNLQTLYAFVYPPDYSAVTDNDTLVRTPGSPEAVPPTRDWKEFFRKHSFALLTVVLPTGIALSTRHVDALVSITGAFAGLFIQYVIPLSLVWYARRDTRINSHMAAISLGTSHYEPPTATDVSADEDDQKQGTTNADSPAPKSFDQIRPISHTDNPLRSPFFDDKWVFFIAGWSMVALVMTVYNEIHKLAT